MPHLINPLPRIDALARKRKQRPLSRALCVADACAEGYGNSCFARADGESKPRRNQAKTSTTGHDAPRRTAEGL
jgi:hypothetical protein